MLFYFELEHVGTHLRSHGYNSLTCSHHLLMVGIKH